MSDSLQLSGAELLTTTRAVRKRLALDRDVPRELLRDCVEVAMQAPTGGNSQGWHFVVVVDEAQRMALADIYRRAWQGYRASDGSIYAAYEREPDGPRKKQHGRVIESADYLVDNLHRVPAHVVPCMPGRVDQMSGAYASVALASSYGSILPATWSFMLAARIRGLGTVWTTAHLTYECEAAEILGVPYDRMTQVALIPTAYYTGEKFSAARRHPVDDVLHFDRWY